MDKLRNALLVLTLISLASLGSCEQKEFHATDPPHEDTPRPEPPHSKPESGAIDPSPTESPLF